MTVSFSIDKVFKLEKQMMPPLKTTCGLKIFTLKYQMQFSLKHNNVSCSEKLEVSLPRTVYSIQATRVVFLQGNNFYKNNISMNKM